MQSWTHCALVAAFAGSWFAASSAEAQPGRGPFDPGKIFERLDRNKDGVISKDEFRPPFARPSDDGKKPGPPKADDRKRPGPPRADDRKKPGPPRADDRKRPGPPKTDGRKRPGPPKKPGMSRFGSRFGSPFSRFRFSPFHRPMGFGWPRFSMWRNRFSHMSRFGHHGPPSRSHHKHGDRDRRHAHHGPPRRGHDDHGKGHHGRGHDDHKKGHHGHRDGARHDHGHHHGPSRGRGDHGPRKHGPGLKRTDGKPHGGRPAPPRRPERKAEAPGDANSSQERFTKTERFDGPAIADKA